MTTKHGESGFTLVEILVVLAIISLLAGVVALNVAPQLNLGKEGKAKAQIQTLATALQTYAMAHGAHPTEAQGLQALVERPSLPPVPDNDPSGGYLQSRTLPRDPWGNPYVYLVPGRLGEAFEIRTFGADGVEGGSGADADISSARLE